MKLNILSIAKETEKIKGSSLIFFGVKKNTEVDKIKKQKFDTTKGLYEHKGIIFVKNPDLPKNNIKNT
jgi:hypothetical protein